MTCGITVAPMIPVASRTDSVPWKLGTRWRTISRPSGSVTNTLRANETAITPTRPAITASSRRNPRRWRPRIANAATPTTSAAGNSGTPVSRFSPSAAPTTSAMSVAIATSSAWIHRPYRARGTVSRQASARLRPLATPSFAESVCTSIAIRFALTTTQTKR
jgi:hypothetical protein